MTEKWRQILAVFLAFALVFLTVSLEAEHSHRAVSAAAIHAPADVCAHNLTKEPGNSRICLACLYGLTHIAPDLSSQTFKPNLDSAFSAQRESAYYFVVIPVSYDLRAPPSL